MKQQIGVFRRIQEEATLALEWIEECIGKTKWWIHILDCAFPIVEDQILDCALQYRRKDNAGQLVLLSDDVNLKIKSMVKVFLHNHGKPCQGCFLGFKVPKLVFHLLDNYVFFLFNLF